jgi:lipopolysaccharide transport system permease protein
MAQLKKCLIYTIATLFTFDMKNIIKLILNPTYWRSITLISKTDLKVIYGDTTLGYLWMFLKTGFQIVFIGFAFKHVIKIEMEHYMLYLSSNIILLNLITQCMNASIMSVMSRGEIIKKINFDLSAFVISDVARSCFVYFINLALLLFVFIFAIKGEIFIRIAMILPYIFYNIIMLVMISYIIAVLYIYVRDISYLLENILMVSIWVTPIYYPVSKMPEIVQLLMNINPFFILTNPVTQILSSGIFPSLGVHISMIFMFTIGLLLAWIIKTKLSRRIVYYL